MIKSQSSRAYQENQQDKRELKTFLEDINFKLPQIKKLNTVKFDRNSLVQEKEQIMFSVRAVAKDSLHAYNCLLYEKVDRNWSLAQQVLLSKELNVYFLRKKICEYQNLRSIHKMQLYKLVQVQNILKQPLDATHRREREIQNVLNVNQFKLTNQSHKSLYNKNQSLEDRQFNFRKERKLELKYLRQEIHTIESMVQILEDDIIRIKKTLKFHSTDRIKIIKDRLVNPQENFGIDDSIRQLEQLDLYPQNSDLPKFFDKSMRKFIFQTFQTKKQIKDLNVLLDLNLQQFFIFKKEKNTDNVIKLFENNERMIEANSRLEFLIIHEEQTKKLAKLQIDLKKQQDDIVKYVMREFSYKSYEIRNQVDQKSLLKLLLGINSFHKYNIKFSIGL